MVTDANDTLSVIMRFHQPRRLPLLDEALFSLALQDWPALEIVVAIQNGDDALREQVLALLEAQPWPAPPCAQVLCLAMPEGFDGRSTLLNEGLARARGRYAAFLDDDDYVYQHGYAALIEQFGSAARPWPWAAAAWRECAWKAITGT